MNYISAEEFLKQSEEVQKAFKDWWKPGIGDLFSTKEIYDEIDVVIDYVDVIYGMNDNFKSKDYSYINDKLTPIPLLQMHQLVQFIEDKTNSQITLDILGKTKEEEYQINLFTRKRNTSLSKPIYSNLGNDLLQALWSVACNIAE